MRILAVITAVLILSVLFPQISAPASAQTNTAIYSGDFGYIIDVDKDTGKFVASICDFKPEKTDAETYDVTIPDTIDSVKYPVTSISSNAFTNYLYRNRIKTVKIPTGVKTIGDYAFSGCTILEKVDFPNELLKVGRYAFYGCSALQKADLPAKTTEIYESAFQNCTSLTEVKFPNTLTYVGQYAFAGCTILKAAEFADALKGIGSSAFEGCSSLAAIKLSKLMTSIDSSVFQNCTSLVNVTIPEGIKSINTSAFMGCSSLTTLAIPENVTSVSAYAFANCKNLTAVIVPYTLQDISDTAFLSSPVEIWGYTGSYADTYAYRNGIPFHANGSVQRITFSADNLYATVNNIAIRSSKGVLVIPPSTVMEGDKLTITVTAPTDYIVDYITINGAAFANGTTYTVGRNDVDISASYRHKDAITTPAPEVTAVTTSNVTTSTTTTSGTTAPITSVINDDDDDEEEDEDDDTTVQIEDDSSREDSLLTVDSDLEDVNGVNVRAMSARSNFIGPATLRITNTPEAYDAARSASEALDIEKAMYYAFDISIYDELGKENQGVLAKGEITFQIPVPTNLLPYADTIQVYHISDETPERIPSTIVEDVNGVKKVEFSASSFSPYMLIASTGDEAVPVIDDEETTRPASDDDEDEENDYAGVIGNDTNNNSGNNTPDASIVDDTRTPTYNRPNYNGNINPHTGAIIAGSAICGVSLICIPLVRSRKKRKRTKSPIE